MEIAGGQRSGIHLRLNTIIIWLQYRTIDIENCKQQHRTIKSTGQFGITLLTHSPELTKKMNRDQFPDWHSNLAY